MKKEIIFKIIELEDYQVLVSKTSSEDEKEPQIKLSFTYDDMMIDAKIDVKTEENQNKIFDNYNEKMAQEFINNVINQFN